MCPIFLDIAHKNSCFFDYSVSINGLEKSVSTKAAFDGFAPVRRSFGIGEPHAVALAKAGSSPNPWRR
jgi:hypothetical protein